jgi:signal transduction histidine kinase
MNQDGRSQKRNAKVSRNKSLKALVLVDTPVPSLIREVIDSLKTLNYNLKLVGITLLTGDETAARLAKKVCKVPVYMDYRIGVEECVPEIVILMSHDRKLHRELLRTLPEEVQIMGPFAIEALRALKTVSGQLGTAETKLRNVEMIKEVLMAGSGVSILVIDEDFRVLDINNAILSRTKMSKKGCLGRPCHWVIHRRMEPCEIAGCPASQVLLTGHSTHLVREERKEDRNNRYFTVSAYPLGTDELDKKCVLMVWKDVTRGFAPVLDRQARSIKNDFSQILHHDKMVALGKLAAAAVHDINNPIQGILTFSKLMKSFLDAGSLDSNQIEKFRMYLDLIAGESARCGDIMRSLLSFARLGTMEKAPVHLNSVLDEVELLVGNRMELQGICFHKDLSEDLPPVRGDRNQVKQAILNLVLNSVEAMPNGGSITIQAFYKPDVDGVQIRISDTGSGIPKSLQESLFEPFVTTKEFGKGTGLGLSVVYGIVIQHEGTIELQKDVHEGTTFVITLPVFKRSIQENKLPQCSG